MSGTQKAAAAAAVPVTVATGIVTNLITNRWSWTLAAALAVLVIFGIALALLPTNPTGQADQRAVNGGKITKSGLKVRGATRVRQTADGNGSGIEDSPIDIQ
ncbi:MAG TPA: hypothetical protein VFP72_16895 [Kineosporiaceae bacterium]|nr:hypothetical protein [Kineosporiaceae bacterium]